MLTASLAIPAGVLAADEATAYAPSGLPTIASDKADYAPGETVTLTGTNWAAGEAVHIVVNDTYGASWVRDVTVTASVVGTITDVFALPTYFVSNYDVTATGPISGTATTTFTDLSIGTYDQCANDEGTGYSSGGKSGCDWINGNLNRNNSSYPEDTATVQRLWLTNLAPSTQHTITLDYGTTKAGKHAYDYLTTFDYSETWVDEADRCEGITGCVSLSDAQLLIPIDPSAGGFDALDSPQYFTMRGGSMGSATVPVVVSGSYAGDSDTRITITFTTPAGGPMCSAGTCGVALWFGAHVAWEGQWGIGTGAGSVSGSPYHVKLAMLDNASIGSRDNQMQASAVTGLGLLTITKVVTGGPTTYPQTDFTVSVLCTDTHGQKPPQPGFPKVVTIGYPVTGSATVLDIPLPSICTVTEPTIPTAPAGYTWGTPVITGSPVTIDAENSVVSVTVANPLTQDLGSLKISKVFDPLTSGFAGTFAINYNCDDGTAHDGTVNLLAGGNQTISGIPTGTTCVVSEPATPTNPTGWTFGSPTLSDSQAPTDDGTVVITTKAATYEVVVTNTITRDLGSLKITKTVIGALPVDFTGSFGVHVVCTGDGGTYDRTIEYPDPGFVTITGIPTGNTCTVTETSKSGAPTGYSWTTEVITGSPTAAISSTVLREVTVTNTVTGRARVIKTLLGLPLTGTQTFTFELREGASAPNVAGMLRETQVLYAGNSTGVTFDYVLVPGQHYQLCEIVDVGWITTLGPSPFQLTIALVNDRICTDFVAEAGVTTTFTVDNTPPPGGGARTIGYWKNHSSCKESNGNQDPILDETLALFPVAIGQALPGFYVGDLYVDTCAEAYAILNKSTLNGKKSASDPAWNFGSQFVAYMLNIQAGASPNATAASAAAAGQAILDAVNLNGNTHANISKPNAVLLNTYAGILDSYNNNTLP